MAEEIRLVGNFTDNITPKLNKLTRSIAQVTRGFEKMQRRLRPISREMGRLAMSSQTVSDNMKKQRASITATTQAMRSYTTATRRAASEQRKLKASAPIARGRGRSAGGGGGGGTGGMIGGAIVGNQLAMMMTQAIIRGFQAGVNLMNKPFKMFGDAIKDGIQDEMSDIQSAGGMFALDKKSKAGDRIFKNFMDARDFQEDLNRELAVSAAALPGVTSDYVQAAKQLTDTVFGTFNKDREAFSKLAVSLGAKEGGGAKSDITKVLSRFTEQSVLLSQGQKGGMPLGMLLEQLVSQENVNMATYKKKYAQLRKNPLLAGMLEEAEKEINKFGAMTAGRFGAVMGALDRALPAEVVNALRMSVDGVNQALASAFFDQEVGLFGLRRQLKTTVKKINSFGQFIDKDGKVVKDAADAVDEHTTVFKLIRDVIAGFGLPLSEIAGILPEVWDPLAGLADAFLEMRQKAIIVLQNFTAFTNWFDDKGFDQKRVRGALAALTHMLNDLGALGKGEFLDIIGQLKSKDLNLKDLVPSLFKSLMKSTFTSDLGMMIGSAAGSMMSAWGTILSEVLGLVESGPFADGLKKGWMDAGGTEGVKKIFRSLGTLLMNAIRDFVTNFPIESAILGSAVLLPGLIGQLMSSIFTGLSSAIGLLGGSLFGGAGTAAGGGGFAAAISGLGVGLPVAIAAAILALGLLADATEAPRKEFTQDLTEKATATTDAAWEAKDPIGYLWGELMHIASDFINGFGDIFQGFWLMLKGALTDPALIEKGIHKIGDGIGKLFTMIGHAIIASALTANIAIEGVKTAIKNLLLALGNVIKNVASRIDIFGWKPFEGAETDDEKVRRTRRAIETNRVDYLAKWNGGGGRGMSLSSAIATENAHKPAGSSLVIANSSETVIPASGGLNLGRLKGIEIGSINVNVTGVDDPRAIANQVADELMIAIEQSSYSELFTS